MSVPSGLSSPGMQRQSGDPTQAEAGAAAIAGEASRNDVGKGVSARREGTDRRRRTSLRSIFSSPRAVAQRGSLAAMALQLQGLESEETLPGTPWSKEHMRAALDTKIARGLTAMAAVLALLLAVSRTLQGGSWYGHETKPRQRSSLSMAGYVEDPLQLSASSVCASPACSPTASRMVTLAMQLGDPVTPPGAQEDAVAGVLAKVDRWDFDSFELDRVTHGHPLVTLGGHLFGVKYNFFSTFNLSQSHFTNFAIQVEQGCGSGRGDGAFNLYHNRRHAADVTQAVHYFLTVCNLGKHLQDAEAIGLVLGALIHDFKHPGRSNTFLIKTSHPLALTYNDVSVLESFHLAEAFRLLTRDRCNFLRNVPTTTMQDIRRTMVSVVLATDLKVHFDVLGEFNSHLADVREGSLKDEDREKTYLSAMKVCIKSADISHPTRESELHLRWARDIIDEFFLQGDEEKHLGLEVSPLCDRDNTSVASSQKNFIVFLVKPLFKSWVTFLDCPAAQRCMTNLEANEAMWAAKERSGDNSIDLVEPPPRLTAASSASKSSPRRPSRIKTVFGIGSNAAFSGAYEGGAGASVLRDVKGRDHGSDTTTASTTAAGAAVGAASGDLQEWHEDARGRAATHDRDGSCDRGSRTALLVETTGSRTTSTELTTCSADNITSSGSQEDGARGIDRHMLSPLFPGQAEPLSRPDSPRLPDV